MSISNLGVDYEAVVREEFDRLLGDNDSSVCQNAAYGLVNIRSLLNAVSKRTNVSSQEILANIDGPFSVDALAEATRKAVIESSKIQ